MNLSDGTVFHGIKLLRFCGGAIYNSGTINLQGLMTLATATDTIYNGGTLNWDLTGGSATLSNWRFDPNGIGTLTITLGFVTSSGSYTILKPIFVKIAVGRPFIPASKFTPEACIETLR